MADLTITSPIATRTLDLATTVQTIEIDRAVVGSVSGLYLYCSAAGGYQIQADGQALASGSTAPTEDYDVLPAGVRVPIPIPGHAEGITDHLPIRIAVWAEAGTPTLHVAPYPVTR